MSYLQLRNLINLFNISTTIALVCYTITRTGIFRRAMNMRATLRDKLLLGVVFGGISVLGTTLGGGNFSDSVIQASLIGPAVAGIIIGIDAGLLAGIIGGIYGLFSEALPDTALLLACIFAGICGGIFYRVFERRRLTFLKGYILGLLTELFFYAMVCF